MTRALAGTLLTVAALALPAAAHARPVKASDDGRPNILVVMTDDQAAADVARMPNVKRLLVALGTSFTDAIDSFPLCCPARATFITGQYAHNHGVGGNFWPYGWYGMKDRGNILPAWLQKAGYRTALIGKWLNGYGGRDAHGEVPTGFDIWRGLLDVSAYDYYNFVMNRNGTLKTWGDAEFARKLVEFARIEVVRNDDGLSGVIRTLTDIFGPAPYNYWGTEDPKDYSPDVTGRITARLVRAEARSRKPFFIWWAPAAPHREDVAVTLMGRPGRDPRPAARYEKKSSAYTLPRPPSFNERRFADKPSNMREHAPPLSEEQIRQLQLDYEGRMGSLLAVDDHVKRLVRTLRATGQLKNTLIVFLSDNGWLQGQHRIPGDKFLPYEESIRVPLIVRGPGVPRGRTVRGQIANIDLTPTLVDVAGARAGRTMDGVSLWPTIRDPRRRPRRVLEIEALAPLFEGDVPVNGWDRPYKGVRTDRYTYVVYRRPATRSSTTAAGTRTSCATWPPTGATPRSRRSSWRKLRRLDRCRGRSCNIAP